MAGRCWCRGDGLLCKLTGIAAGVLIGIEWHGSGKIPQLGNTNGFVTRQPKSRRINMDYADCIWRSYNRKTQF